MELLAEARRLGIDVEYVDARGRRRRVPDITIIRITEALRAATAARAHVPAPPAFARKAYQGVPGRWWLIAAQLYAVRSRRNWGIGDFADLRGLIELAATVGAGGVGVNPLHALLDDAPAQPSPYSPSSRLFLNPLYIAVDEIAEFADSAPADIADAAARLREAPLVDYVGVAALKQRCLRAAHRAFAERATAERRADFAAFRRARAPDLTRFACFEVLRTRLPGPWWQWPPEWRSPDARALVTLRREAGEEIEYREFLQWVADRQLKQCRDRARELRVPVGLYLDVAVGVRPDGFDAWNAPDSVMRTLAIGAPPDLLNTAGQNWGLAGFSGVGLQAHAFAPYRAMLRAVMRHAGAIRLDHVLGLKRLYVIPEGMPASEGAYVRLPFEQMLSIAAEESVRNRCVVIGEDLGTVPEGFRAQLAQWGLWSYQVMLFERDAAGRFHPPDHYAEQALATFTTHDLPTFAGWVDNEDLRVKQALGLDPGETTGARADALAALRQALGVGASDDLHFAAVVHFLATSRARLLAIGLDDVLGVRDQANVPGTVEQHPNWRRKLPIDLESLADDVRLRAIARMAADGGRAALPGR